MSGLCVEPVDAKRIRISGIEPFLANCLEGMAEVLEKRDSPQVKERLFPDPTPANVKMNEDWQKLISPDLRHLFVHLMHLYYDLLKALGHRLRTGRHLLDGMSDLVVHRHAQIAALDGRFNHSGRFLGGCGAPLS